MGLDPWNVVLMRYGPLQLRKTRELLRRLHGNPSDFLRILHLYEFFIELSNHLLTDVAF